MIGAMTASAGNLEGRFVGCLIGQCLGDALGFVVEGYDAAHCGGYVRDWLRAGRAGEIGRPPFAFGQYTDDSQLARELVRSYLACDGFDPAHYAELIADIFTGNRVVGRGRSTEAAALRLAAGVPWHEAGTPAPMAGNGSAMRAGPIGLMFHDDAEALVRAAHDQGRATHADPRCSAGAVMIAGAVAGALRGAPLEPGSLVDELADLAETVEPSLAAELRQMEGWLEMEPEGAGPAISRAGYEAGAAESGWDGIAPFVVPSVLWSLYAFLRSPDDYWETICTAIAVGGDVDTTAAMAGAISGAYNGAGAIPQDLARRLNDQGDWVHEALVELAQALHGRVTRPEVAGARA